jgi:crotonobetaine/carnitine-CoA ligase
MRTPLEVLRLYPEHDYTLHGAFESRRGCKSDVSFLLSSDETQSWDTFGTACEKLARLLAARGIRKGDRVAVIALNHSGHVLALFALARLGAIMVPVNPEFGLQETAYVLNHAEVSGVIASTATIAKARQAAADLATQPWFALLDGHDAQTPNLRDMIHAAPPAALPDDISREETCVIVYTSGTTGNPKGVMHSQRSFVTAGEAFVQRVHLQPEDRCMIVLPLFHMNALFYSVAGALAAGASMAIVPRFSASTFWQTAVALGATTVNIIEAIGSILPARPRSEFRSEHRIRAIYGVRQHLAETFRREFGIRHLFGGFGMTEIPGVTCNPIDAPNKPGSMGTIGRHPDPARPWAECRIVDDTGQDVPVGEVGELAVKTPIIMQGYFRDPEQTRAAFRDGWFLTGDLVRRDGDGFFFHISRKKDIIRRRGENIAGAELDRVIGAHPGVLEVAAIPVPAELGEDEILAVIVPRPGSRTTAEEIANWCGERLAPMKVPRYVLFVDALPHTPTHKVAKMALRQDTTLKQRATDLHAQPKD